MDVSDVRPVLDTKSLGPFRRLYELKESAQGIRFDRWFG